MRVVEGSSGTQSRHGYELGPARASLDLNALALDWSRGRYLSPVICGTEGDFTRGGQL